MRRQFLYFFIAAIFSSIIFLWFGCKGSQPEIILTAINCPKDSIEVEATLTVSGNSPNMTVKLEAYITCNGRPVKNPEVKLEFWWPNGTMKKTGDAQGKVVHRKTGLHSHPGTQTVPITVKGSDGDKKHNVTLSAPGQ